MAVFEDPTVQHLDAILNELYEESPKPIGPQILAENLNHLQLGRAVVRGTLARARADHRWVDSNDDGKWFLTTTGSKEVERRREAAAKEQEEQAKRFESSFNMDEETADGLQSSVAA